MAAEFLPGGLEIFLISQSGLGGSYPRMITSQTPPTVSPEQRMCLQQQIESFKHGYQRFGTGAAGVDNRTVLQSSDAAGI